MNWTQIHIVSPGHQKEMKIILEQQICIQQSHVWLQIRLRNVFFHTEFRRFSRVPHAYCSFTATNCFLHKPSSQNIPLLVATVGVFHWSRNQSQSLRHVHEIILLTFLLLHFSLTVDLYKICKYHSPSDLPDRGSIILSSLGDVHTTSLKRCISERAMPFDIPLFSYNR